jgi:1,4-alpha-glucan branching enzyme
MTPVVRNDWEIYVTGKVFQREIFNSDLAEYWGTGTVYNPEIRSELVDEDQKRYKLSVNLPAMGGIILK